MTRRGQKNWSTATLGITASILRCLSSNTLATLALVQETPEITQSEIADELDRSQSTVSSYYHSLSLKPAPVSLVTKSKNRYVVSQIGEGVIDLITGALEQQGFDDIDWTSQRYRKQVDDFLSPLCASRSEAPFFILDALGNRSGIVTLGGNPDPVPFDRVVSDVVNRMQEQDTPTSKKQIGQILDRFEEEGVLACSGDRIYLEEKGISHAHLMGQLAKLIDRRVDHGKTSKSADSDDSWDGMDSIVNQLRRERIATAWSIENADSRLIDDSHYYHLLKRIDVLDTPNNEWSSIRWLTVENVTSDPTTALTHKESGENKIEFDDLALEAYLDEIGGRRLATRDLVDQQPSFEQKVKVLFPEPLPPGESITVCYRIRWPNELSYYSPSDEGELTQSISLTRYMRGVAELQFGVVDLVNHAGIDCRGLVEEKNSPWEKISATPVHFEAEERVDLASVHGEGYRGYLYTITNPDSPSYRIYYNPVQ
ncbi:winged helix-turn-helix domain-containing protein [Halocatena halophila]|uniref:winged helix-turn-helix domain-containing protein n=1 Tax=Halocatena halophila TaxID=2814576 RepID=UPI002ED0DBED